MIVRSGNAVFPALLGLLVLLGSADLAIAQDGRMKALIVDGQNNHGNWPQTTQMMKSYMQDSGLFAVDVATTAKSGTDETFAPRFSDYQVVVSNYNGAAWPEETRKSFE